MISYENTKTVRDLVWNTGREYAGRVFLRYEENDVVYEVTYDEFAAQCRGVAAWLREQDAAAGHKVRVGLMGSSSHHYLVFLLGVMASGNVVVPLDVQLNEETFADNVNRSDLDILFYDWDHYGLVEAVKEKCPRLRACISLQHGKHVPCSDQILKGYAGISVDPVVSEEDCAMVLFTSGTTGRGKGVMLSNRNLMDNNFCTTDKDHPEKEVYLNILPIHHVFCINGDVFTVMRYGSVLCLNRDMARLAAHIQLFQPTVIRMVPMVAKALYNKIAILSRQDTGRSLNSIKQEVLGKRLHKIISGGGYLAPELAANFNRLGISIAQGYGMSECSPKISSPDWSRPDKVASVGKIVDGVFDRGYGSVAERNFRPHVTCTRRMPDNRFVLSVDNGIDQVKIYRFNDKEQRLVQVDAIRCELESAPRHFRYSKDGKFIYLMYELKKAIDVYTYKTGDRAPVIEKIQTISTTSTKKPDNLTAACAMRMSVDQKYIYCTNAGENTISVYKRDEETGLLTMICCLPISGAYPKDVAVFPDGRHIASVNHDSGTISFFKVDYEKGLLVMSGRSIPVNEPNCCAIVKIGD